MSKNFSTNKSDMSEQKLRGGYYTPLRLAKYLSDWALREKTERILEPSCGDGNFIQAVYENLASRKWDDISINIVAIELQKIELERAQNKLGKLHYSGFDIEWINDDFFEVYETLKDEPKFNIILGNPPFIRFQNFNTISRDKAFKHLRNLGYKPTKLANIWTAFVQLNISLLEEGGRLAMVLPAELLQVKYATELRDQLSRQFQHIIIVAFKKLVFPDIQQEVILLLAEGKRHMAKLESDIHTIEFNDGLDLINSDDLKKMTSHAVAKHSRERMKWTSLFLSDPAFNALDAAEKNAKVIRLNELADVAVGVVTGHNNFFAITNKAKEEFLASAFTVPVIGRTSHLKSIIFTKEDFCNYQFKNQAYLLNLNGISREHLPKELQDYLTLGEEEGVNQGYKCKMRRRWFDVPSIYIPDAFLFRQIHKYSLLVVNEAQATSTDTIHRVRFLKEVDSRQVAASYFNSLTLAWTEVSGRSYGGGVLELEPNEAKELPIPFSNNEVILDTKLIDSLIRNKDFVGALNYVDEKLLKNYLGFTDITINNIRTAWVELRDRRIRRNHSKK